MLLRLHDDICTDTVMEHVIFLVFAEYIEFLTRLNTITRRLKLVLFVRNTVSKWFALPALWMCRSLTAFSI